MTLFLGIPILFLLVKRAPVGYCHINFEQNRSNGLLSGSTYTRRDRQVNIRKNHFFGAMITILSCILNCYIRESENFGLDPPVGYTIFFLNLKRRANLFHKLRY